MKQATIMERLHKAPTFPHWDKNILKHAQTTMAFMPMTTALINLTVSMVK